MIREIWRLGLRHTDIYWVLSWIVYHYRCEIVNTNLYDAHYKNTIRLEYKYLKILHSMCTFETSARDDEEWSWGPHWLGEQWRSSLVLTSRAASSVTVARDLTCTRFRCLVTQYVNSEDRYSWLFGVFLKMSPYKFTFQRNTNWRSRTTGGRDIWPGFWT